jgi:hypothetical protein
MEIKKQINDLLIKYKDLIYIEDKNIIVGKIFINENDYYEMSIDLSPYPIGFPNVEEIGERIPKKADRHIYTDNGNCCFTTKAKSEILLKTKIKSLESFIKLIVIPYLENNSYFEINKIYFTEEYSHNSKGILEGYRDILGLENDYRILTVIYDRLTNNEAKYQSKCYCGGNTPLRNCKGGKHFKNYNKLKLVEINTLGSDFTNFVNYMKK